MANVSARVNDVNQGDRRIEKDIVVYMMQPNGVLVEMPEEFKNQVVQWVIDLSDEKTRETALLELSKRREQIPELAVWLWHSFGCMAALLQETVNTYIYMDPATLTAHQSNRVCNALALLQCVASHKETRKYFLEARIPLFLYPFLANRHTTRPFEYLRLTSLGVIGALVKTDDPDVIVYLLNGENSEIIPLCLKIMDSGSELSKTVATFIIQKILWDDKGLNYICHTYQRFTHVATVLKTMVDNFEVPGDTPSAAKKGQIQNQATAAGRLLKHILRCYLRFSEHARAKEPLAQPKLFPAKLLDSSLLPLFREDKSSVIWLAQICNNVGVTSEIVQQLGGGIIPVAAAAGGPNPITSPEHFMMSNLSGQPTAGQPQQQPFGSTATSRDMQMQMQNSGMQSQQLQSPSLMPTTTATAGGAMHGAGNALNMAGGMRTSPNLLQMPPGGIMSSGVSLGNMQPSLMGPPTHMSAGGAAPGGQQQQMARTGAGMQMFGGGGGGAGGMPHQSQLHGGMGAHNMNMGPPSLFAGAGGFGGVAGAGQQQQQSGSSGNAVTPGLPPTHMHRHGGM